MQSSGKPLFYRYEEFRGFRDIASDITVQIEAERRTEMLANAIEQLSDMFVLWGPDDRIVISNRKFKELNRAVIETTEPGPLFEKHIRTVMERNFSQKPSVERKSGFKNDWKDTIIREGHSNCKEVTDNGCF